MALTQINGGTQIKASTVTKAQTDTSLISADGTRAFSGDQSHGGFKITNLGAPSATTDAATKAYVDGVAQGLDAKPSARAATVGSETFTIASGSVTQISGTTLDGQSPAVGERILIKDAPASTGVGSVGSSQPGNGLYTITNATTNLSVSRATEQSGSIHPAGDYVFVEAGTTNGGSGWVVTTPSNATGSFTYGTNNMAWVQFSGAGEITVDSTITKTGNALSRAALTGDVTASGGSNATTIAANAVSLAKMANLAAHTVIANTGSSAATPSAVSLSPSPTASSVVQRDGNGALSGTSFIPSYDTTSASGSTVLTYSSDQVQIFNGSSSQTVVLPDATTCSLGQTFILCNYGSQALSVSDTDLNTLSYTVSVGATRTVTLAKNDAIVNPQRGTWTFSGEIVTVDSSLAKTGSQLSRAALTGDVTASAGSNSTTIATNAVSLSKMAQLAANSVIGNSTGSTATPTAVPMSTSFTSSTVAMRDSVGTLYANSFAPTTQFVTTNGSGAALTASGPTVFYFTGTLTFTATMPNATVGGMSLGRLWTFYNAASNTVTINANGGSTLVTLAAGQIVQLMLNDNSTSAGTWTVTYLSTTAALSAPGAGMVKSTGSALQTATASTDYMAPGGFVTRETPSGTVNGSNVTFTLANTPLSGTEEVFLNGILQEPGAGNDYTISGATITYLSAPLTGDKLRCSYLK